VQSVVKTEPLHTQLYHLLKQKLIEGFYEPGERLIEARIAEEYSVSRAPVREALRMLIHDGLVIQKNNALCVFQPTLNDLVEIYQCRQKLESLAASLAAQNINDTQLERLSTILSETNEAWKKGDLEQVIQLNIQFHEIILDASNNSQLISLTSMIRDKVTYLRNCSFKGNVRAASFIQEHEKIVDALRERDGEKAELLMNGHIENDLQALISLYSNRG